MEFSIVFIVLMCIGLTLVALDIFDTFKSFDKENSNKKKENENENLH